MQVYDKVIETTRELLKPFPVKELNRNHAKPWNLLKENEFLLQKEVALTWWLGITYFVNKVRTKFNLRGIWILNRVVGSIVMLVSLAGLIFTLLGESLY